MGSIREKMDKMCITDPRRSRGKTGSMGRSCFEPSLHSLDAREPLPTSFRWISHPQTHHAEVMPFEMCERIDSDENCLLVARLHLNFQFFYLPRLGDVMDNIQALTHQVLGASRVQGCQSLLSGTLPVFQLLQSQFRNKMRLLQPPTRKNNNLSLFNWHFVMVSFWGLF